MVGSALKFHFVKFLSALLKAASLFPLIVLFGMSFSFFKFVFSAYRGTCLIIKSLHIHFLQILCFNTCYVKFPRSERLKKETDNSSVTV